MVYLVTGSKSKKPRAPARYLASSAPRLGAEMCTSISIDGFIACLHLGSWTGHKGRAVFVHEERETEWLYTGTK